MAIKRLKRGDVFTIPLGDGRFGLGQTVKVLPHDEIFVVVFDEVVDSEAPISDLAGLVETAGLRLGAWTMSVLFEIDHWKLVGNVPVREDFPMPAYKVAIDRPGNFYVEDWAHIKRRPATAGEVARLPTRSSFSPAAVEGALKAQLGLDKWYEQFDKMLPGGPSTQEMFGDD